jgi:hypothetical protein
MLCQIVPLLPSLHRWAGLTLHPARQSVPVLTSSILLLSAMYIQGSRSRSWWASAVHGCVQCH